jgi:hypothetical protein
MYRACIAVVEERDLVNPARRLRPVFDDHRDKHIEALDAEFSLPARRRA